LALPAYSEIYDSYTADDRKAVFFIKVLTVKYYIRINGLTPDATTEIKVTNNFPLMRYTGVVLTYAET